MVNAKLDPEELPQNTLQVKTDISINSVNKDKIHFVNKDKRFPFLFGMPHFSLVCSDLNVS